MYCYVQCYLRARGASRVAWAANICRVCPRSRGKALQNHAELTGYVCLWEGTPMFAKRQRVLSPDQYEIVDVRTSEGTRRAMLFPRAILKAEWDADALLRNALTIRGR